MAFTELSDDTKIPTPFHFHKQFQGYTHTTHRCESKGSIIIHYFQHKEFRKNSFFVVKKYQASLSLILSIFPSFKRSTGKKGNKISNG